MAKKELRLAVVIYGGASLAVYMHGVTKELLKLVRASKVLHEIGAERASDLPYHEGPDRRDPDTEAVYFEALKQISKTSDFRVVIDVIAGASAGAINGVMLGKALVDDALLDAQTSLWMTDADVDHLGAENTSAWRKWYLYPFLRALSLWMPRDVGRNPETREKIARLVRSSWFQPPFSGERLSHHFFDGLDAMAASRRPDSTLLPPGQRLDVYASITDLVGYPRAIQLHEQLVAREMEHAAFCRLSHVASVAGQGTSDFVDENNPALVWAARASSSYAGAFQPFHHAEIQRVLSARQLPWQREQSFLQSSIYARDGSPAHRHFDPADRYFVDGGIVNNKPFGVALEALNHRASDRQVDRCLVYIEPTPNLEGLSHPEKNLGYLSTLRAALSSIPRNQPRLEDLNEIVAQDARVQVNRRVVDGNRADITRMVADIQAANVHQASSGKLIGYLRAQLMERAEEEMGIAFHAYVQRRVWRLADALAREWLVLADEGGDARTARGMELTIAHWWQAVEPTGAATRENRQEEFLDQFDVTFRIRRLQFLIRRMNQHEDRVGLAEDELDALDSFKQVAYEFMERCYDLRRYRYLSEALISTLVEAAGRVPLFPEEAKTLLRQVSDALSLKALDAELDAAFHGFSESLGDAEFRQAIMADYLGFPIYDVLLMAPGTPDGGPDPLTRIRVERISPADSLTLNEAFGGLRCRDFMGFIGFFNRAYREHDYLWGRLNGADRLVDMLTTAADGAIDDPLALKKALFAAIVERERRRLYRCDDQLAAISRAIEAL